MTNLFIHVGPHKTGTTSIQQFLLSNIATLEAEGFAVFLEGEKKGASRANAWGLAHCFIREDLTTPMRASRQLPASDSAHCGERVESFRRWVESVSQETCILSSEAFSFLRTASEARALHSAFYGLFDHITPILAYRPADQRRRSWSAQLEKMAVEVAVEEGGGASVSDEWYFDWDSLESFWAQFGDPIVIDYQRAVSEFGSIVPAFEKEIGLTRSVENKDYFLNVTHSKPVDLAARFRRKVGRMLRN